MKIIDAYVQEGPMFEQRSYEDGEINYSFYIFVEAVNEANKIFTHTQHFEMTDRAGADRLAARVYEAGEINLDHWLEGSVWDQYKTEQTYEEEKEESLFNEYYR